MNRLRKLSQSRAALVVLALLLGCWVGYSLVSNVAERQEAEATADALAPPLAALCVSEPVAAVHAGADCAQAAQVARDGVNGEDGADGADGRGILGTTLRDGRLIVAFSDGTTDDVGQVAGEDGRGITSTLISDGRLIVVFDDGSRLDVGAVVGQPGDDGRGIASVGQADGRLIVTYTDGSITDAGPLPQGPPGPQGESGANGGNGQDGAPAPSVQSETRTYDDGSTERCTRTGGSDADPEFACDRTKPTTTTAPGPLDLGGDGP